MRIGYSCWGFLGPGVTDTPDGGRSHRRTLIDGLAAAGHDIVFLQANRDLDEAGQDLRDYYTWDGGVPDIDVLFLEWRWPIHGRNTTECGTASHTCDLHRQTQLVGSYTLGGTLPTILWDKDRQLPTSSPLRRLPNLAVCEPALAPSPGAVSLLFPVADTDLDTADPATLAAQPRPVPLVYVGNQYDRDRVFGEYFAPAASCYSHQVAGKWRRTTAWPHVNFIDRCPFEQVADLHGSALATVLLLPDRYAEAGHMTQRLFEAVLAGCMPITPATISFASTFTPTELHADSGHQVIQRVRELQAIAGTVQHAALIGACLQRLDIFRLSRQLATVDQTIRRLTDDHSACLPASRVVGR